MLVRSAHINVMMKAAGQAGRALIRDFNEVEHLQVTRKGPTDFVSAADRRAEDIIRESLTKARPDHGFLLEESGVIAGADPDRRFIVDPLDGTTNFLHGLPHFAISIALEIDKELVAGVVFDPIKDEYFWAELNKGAFLGSRRLRVSGRRRLEDAVFSTGIPSKGRYASLPDLGRSEADSFADLERVSLHSAGIRRWGAAALDLAYVAAGRYDGFWEWGLAPWDTAAGVLIASEAGAQISDPRGKPWKLSSVGLVAATPSLHGPLLKTLAG